SRRRARSPPAGGPSPAGYGARDFGRGSRIDAGKTEYVGAGDESAQTKQPSPIPPPVTTKLPRNVPPLKVGGLLPHTGGLAISGPPMFAAAKLAVKELNAAGGILGQPVEWVDGDDGTS